MHNKGIFISLAIVLVLSIGCSGGGGPVSPDLETSDPARPSAVNNMQLWGFWAVSLDPITETAEVVPLRGIEFTTNVTQFMQPPIAP